MTTTEWQVPQPEIKSYCYRCERSYLGRWDTAHEGFGVISPRGIAHIGVDGGDTACGIDATGEKWWWKL